LDPDVRAAAAMSPHMADSIRDRLKQQLRKECQVGSPSPYQVTAYVSTDGKVITASASSPDPNAELTIDCLIDLVKNVEFPSPGSYAGKISFAL
jgi:phage-related baseplate assembly protein